MSCPSTIPQRSQDESESPNPRFSTSASRDGQQQAKESEKVEQPGRMMHGSPRSTTRKRARIREIFRLVFRSLGLNVISHFLNSLTGHGVDEPKKIAILKDRVVSLFRGLIHVIPVSVALCEIVLNWNNYYVGTSIDNQAVYQLVAKSHEVMIQASLAYVVLSYIRIEMTLGSGIPFGALFCGLQINQLGYLWSMELWGSMRSISLPFRRKAWLIILIVTSIVLAAVSGPSSAVLLVPRLDYWSAGSAGFWVNASIDDLYPTYLDANQVRQSCSFAPEDTTSNDCPSSEWEKIKQLVSLDGQILPKPFQQTYAVEFTPQSIELFGKSSLRQLYYGRSGNSTNSAIQYILISSAQQAAIADALTNIGALWYLSLFNVTAKRGHGSALSEQSDAIHVLNGDSYQPFTMSACALDIIHDEFDQAPVLFPYLQSANNPALINANVSAFAAIKHPNISRAELLDTPGDPSGYRLRWVEFPQSSFNGSSIGAVVLFPDPTSNASHSNNTQNILLCNLSAGWGRTQLLMHTSHGNAGIVSHRIVTAAGKRSDTNPTLQGSTDPNSNSENENAMLGYNFPTYPQRHINMTVEWAQYLNPQVRESNTSVFNLIMQEKISVPGIPDILTSQVAVEQALVNMMSNGLARTGFAATFQGSPKNIRGSPWIDGNFWLSGKGDIFNVSDQQSKEWAKLRVDSTLEGYSYNTKTTPPKIAITVLLLYCIIALVHLLYSCISGISSTSWDSVAEVTALAVNSAPTTTLRNTCAGISELNIFKQPVRVLAKPDEEGHEDHLELVFGVVNDDEVKDHAVKVGRPYGTMHSSEAVVE